MLLSLHNQPLIHPPKNVFGIPCTQEHGRDPKEVCRARVSPNGILWAQTQPTPKNAKGLLRSWSRDLKVQQAAAMCYLSVIV